MKFTYMLPSEDNPKLEYPVSFYINLMHPHKGQSSLAGYAAKYPQYNTSIKGICEPKLYEIYGSIPKDPNKTPDLKIYYENRKIDVMDFVWPGCRTDDVMFPIFLETYGPDKRSKDFHIQYLYLEHEVVIKCLLKFKSKVIFYMYSDVNHKIEAYDIGKNTLTDLMDGNPIRFYSVKGNPALNFTLYANDLVDMLKDGIIFIRKK